MRTNYLSALILVPTVLLIACSAGNQGIGTTAPISLTKLYPLPLSENLDTVTQTPTLLPIGTLKPSLTKRYKVRVEEGVVYGTGETLNGADVKLRLDLAIPNTGKDALRPLFIHIHGGGFKHGSRSTQWDAAKRGWVAASIDYRLAGDEPLPSKRVQEYLDAVGGPSSSALSRSAVAAVEDTLVAIDYLISRATELAIDKNRIVLKGDSAGAFTALHVAYCSDKFNITRPHIAAVIDFSGGIGETCGGGSAIDPGEPPIFIAHGTEDIVVSFTY